MPIATSLPDNKQNLLATGSELSNNGPIGNLPQLCFILQTALLQGASLWLIDFDGEFLGKLFVGLWDLDTQDTVIH